MTSLLMAGLAGMVAAPNDERVGGETESVLALASTRPFVVIAKNAELSSAIADQAAS